MELLVWSFQALLMGVHPTVDHLGRPLGKGSSFDLVKGQQLTHQGYRCVTWSIQGDHEFLSNTLGLHHWSSLHPCWECDCLNNPEIPFAKWVKNSRPSLQGFTRVTQWAECFRTRRRGHLPFTRDNIVNFFLQRPASQSFNCHVGRLEVYVIYKSSVAGQIASY